MKPSGIEWIGDIPADWEVRRLKGLGEQTIGLTYSPQDITDNSGTLVLRSSNIQNGKLVLDRDDNVYVSIDVENKILKDEDILICSRNGSRNLVGKTAFVITYGKKLSYGAFTTIFRSNNKFLFYVFNAGVFEYHLASYNTSTINQLTTSMLNEIRVPFPPVKTQRKIVDYLDEECGEIDATIAKQKESIEKLKAYKQSLISETVTKGLDKSAPLKPSGIEWIGDIPAHWEVKRIKELFSFGKGLPISKEDLIENGVPVINYGQIHSKDNNGTSIKDSLIRYVDLNYKNTNMTSLVESGDFIFADTSEDLDGCGNCIYVDSKYPIFAGYHCIILRSIKRNSSKYLAYLFQMDAWRTQIRRDVTGVKVFSISKKILGKSYILLPPRYEQECIVNYLQEKCNEIDIIINKKQNIIQKLDAYKKSLIFECVTGKRYLWV